MANYCIEEILVTYILQFKVNIVKDLLNQE